MATDWDYELFNKTFEEINLHEVVSVPSGTICVDVVEQMASKNIGCLPICEGKKLVGIFTEKDFAVKCIFDDNWKEKKIDEFMTANPFSLKVNQTVLDAMRLFFKKTFRHIPITNDNGEIKAVLSVKDILKYVLKGNEEILQEIGTLRDWNFLFVDQYTENFSFENTNTKGLNTSLFFTPLKRLYNSDGFKVVDIGINLYEAFSLMVQSKVTVFLVQEYGTKLKGIFTERDLLRKLRDKSVEDLKGLYLRDFMTPNPDTLLHKHYLGHALNNMFTFNYRNIVIVDEDHFPLGQFNLLDVVKFLGRGLIEE
ncbi:MAG: CBS domain-containing protein [Oligoflexia bacterium]|nr:CBS domain-containing protein [Oligoflexia bacterium]